MCFCYNKNDHISLCRCVIGCNSRIGVLIENGHKITCHRTNRTKVYVGTGMLISKVTEDGCTTDNCSVPVEDNTHEYQTANQLFELMEKNQNFDTNDGGALTPRELVLLYKNIDRGTKLMSNANENMRSKSNQHVETVVYNDDVESDYSDLNEVYSSDDLQSVMLINKEQIDFLSGQASVEHPLCHKFGDLELQTSSYNNHENHFLIHDVLLQEQLKPVKAVSINKDITCTSVQPPSLLDYICFRRLEDNYNFYMDNIIIYVTNTIEQLKRISNGDYLTEKAREKWKEVERVEVDNNTKILATSTSIPLHVECKLDGLKSTWDDIVHSPVDVRYLSKILEKKIIVEIPKFINGSYTLLSNCSNDNLIITCKKENQPADESRVDVVLQLERSETGHVLSKISSIMILQTTAIEQEQQVTKSPLPLMLKTVDHSKQENDVKITELNSSTEEENNYDDNKGIYSDCYGESLESLPQNYNQGDVSDRNGNLNNSREGEDIQGYQSQKEATFEISPVDLRIIMKKLDIQSALQEEAMEDMSQSSLKKKTPMIVKIKSPYENQSLIMEEKKRRKLLEIREKRERRKKALLQNCKIIKHKFDIGGVAPQASTSVTKLSITNKSFYNSIYGDSTNVDTNQVKNRNHKKDLSKELTDTNLINCGSELETSGTPSEIETQKFINRSYYLDDTMTEMMYMNMKQEAKEKAMLSPSTSCISCEYPGNLNLLSELMIESLPKNSAAEMKTPKDMSRTRSNEEKADNDKDFHRSDISLHVVPSNTPKDIIRTENDAKKLTVECRKSIDKIYQLMNKMDKNQYKTGSKSQNTLSMTNNDSTVPRDSCTQESWSGISLKHQVSSSFSTFSLEKHNHNEVPQKRTRSPSNVIPKVIISSRSQNPQSIDIERKKKDSKMNANKARDKNPLKAISQLLQEFENVQRNRIKPRPEQKPIKKVDTGTYNKEKSPRQVSTKGRSRFEQHHNALNGYTKVSLMKPAAVMDIVKVPFQQIPIENKYPNRGNKKKITEILDEAKEARGEAVKGPSKFNSRLNSLAQPKRTYVQAHSAEYQNRYGRNFITDRLQRLAATPSQPLPEKTSRLVINRNKIKRTGQETVSPAVLKQPFQSGLPIERGVRPRNSNSSSPDLQVKQVLTVVGTSYKHNINAPEPPKLKKKMVAVESYVKNHYWSTQPLQPTVDKPLIPKLRAPVLPNDIDPGSSSSSPRGQESTVVGSKLHRIIESLIKNNSQSLEILTECFEATSKSGNAHDDGSLSVNHSPFEENTSIDSDIASTPKNNAVLEKHDKQELNLHDCLSVGATSKHQTTGQLNLSSKSSIQQMVLLQSGDTSSLVVKAAISQKLLSGRLTNIKSMHGLRNTNWDFPVIPNQVTVAYAMPEYEANRNTDGFVSPSLSQLLQQVSKTSLKDLSGNDSVVNNYTTKNNTFINPSTANVSSANNNLSNNSHDMQLQSIQCHQFSQMIPLNPIVSLKNVSCCKNAPADISPDLNNVLPAPVMAKQTTLIIKQITKLTQTSLEDKSESEVTSKNSEPVDYTASLDILVGLLNEIQKITTCQTNITKKETEDFKELETIVKNTGSIVNSKSSYNMSLTSLDKLRYLESSPSVYSFYLSDGEVVPNKMDSIKFTSDIDWHPTGHNIMFRRSCVDKEVSANIANNKYVDRLTDVPSLFLPVTINHSTNMSNSMMLKGPCQPSTQSLFSIDYYSSNSNAYSTSSTYSEAHSDKVIELLPQLIRIDHVNTSVACHRDIEETVEIKPHKQKVRYLKKYAIMPKKENVKTPNNDCYLESVKFDSIMKFKRDVLVTVYSMLVLTVFAALSFPDMLYDVGVDQ